MSIFRTIMSRIWGGSAAAAPGPAEALAAVAAPGGTGAAIAAPGGMGAAVAAVDVEAVLTALAARAPQRLDWRHSIVDLMKLLDLDASLTARKDLAEELGYAGPRDGSAEMNLWLHRAVMRRLAENGGQVPEDLRG